MNSQKGFAPTNLPQRTSLGRSATVETNYRPSRRFPNLKDAGNERLMSISSLPRWPSYTTFSTSFKPASRIAPRLVCEHTASSGPAIGWESCQPKRDHCRVSLSPHRLFVNVEDNVFWILATKSPGNQQNRLIPTPILTPATGFFLGHLFFGGQSALFGPPGDLGCFSNRRRRQRLQDNLPNFGVAKRQVLGLIA